VPIDLLNFEGQRIPLTPEQIGDGSILEDDYYPAFSVTWIRPNFWAEEFQLRFAFSETVARPDLREVSQSTYIDPLTEARVRGNPRLKPSQLTNFDMRAEWFFASGDNFTVSLFYKDIDDPIETVQGGATEDNILFNFVNGDNAEILGLEVAFLKNLQFMSGLVGSWVEQLFVAGNFTVSDSELDIDPAAGGVGNLTNFTRQLTQHSDWVANLQVGFDSFNSKHSASLVYNSYADRIFFAGINGFDDAREQPFHSLDLVYSYYPTENVSFKLRLRNLLDEQFEIEQDGVTILEQDVGMTMLFDVKWAL
jgi:outer membrane receptor protein involved in Fe transport